VSETNQKIFDFMAPRLKRFLASSASGEIFRDSDEPSGRFLSYALSLYKEVRQDSLALQNSSLNFEARQGIESSRRDKVMQANILATFGEQLYRVEPGFAKLKDILDSLTAFMSYQTPGMNQRLASESALLNWGILYERMGIDPSKAPSDPYSITPEQFPDLLPPEHPLFQGTISQVLVEGTKDPELAALLKAAPEVISEPKAWG
jgi:hypothetical protein